MHALLSRRAVLAILWSAPFLPLRRMIVVPNLSCEHNLQDCGTLDCSDTILAYFSRLLSSFVGERGTRQMRHPTTMDGLVSPEPRMAGGDLGAVAAVHVLVHCPVSGVAYTEVCYSAFVKTSRLCDTYVPGLERGTELGDGTFHVRRPASCEGNVDGRGTWIAGMIFLLWRLLSASCSVTRDFGKRHISCAPSCFLGRLCLDFYSAVLKMSRIV